MTQPAAPLPQVLDDIARLAGEDAARKVAEAVGGTRVYIPPVPGPDHWLSKLVGLEAARKIGDHFTGGFAGTPLEIPLADTGFIARMQAKCDAMLLAGTYSERDIARACEYTIRTVRRRRAALKRAGQRLTDRRQGDLFGA
ncbi:hypothetical protein [Erythrobacter sp. WG]|uniref:hypothetical protein n=1 Tax=Erythrobacter sp. WG TaxID=2985510 RepID=UPI00226DC7DC|nr:hypothetical protein [Erythrobacter sp. WG]MCX9146599.1 hypothetical protein [Erythrobacter sp. WG]